MNMPSFTQRLITIAIAIGTTTTICQSTIAQPQSGKHSHPTLGEAVRRADLIGAVTEIENSWENKYEGYFQTNLSGQPPDETSPNAFTIQRTLGAEEISDILATIARQTGKKTALIYVVPDPKQLELVLVMPQGKPIRKSIPEAQRKALIPVVQDFTKQVTQPTNPNSSSYLASAKQLYQWIIAPLEPNLQAQSIDTLIFCVGDGLRTLPLAALHDGQKFLVEKYSLGLIPAFNMVNAVYKDIKNTKVLAMGASEFTNLSPLPAVPIELSTIFEDLSGVRSPGPWLGESMLNQQFTLDNLKTQLKKQPYGIVHLATHAEFKPGEPKNSYIQFWDNQLSLDRMSQLQWNNPQVELLVLSACSTALGDKDAEMGFAGLAVHSGVKSALASLWNVSDEGTLALMTEFYQQLRTSPIKAEALRQAQIGMLQGQVRLQEGKLHGPELRSGVQLPKSIAILGTKDLTHPYYWAGFTMIGNPW